ncbi:MAG: hypothetical protein JW838_09760 [Spirochaetes bacterium]|nr:hypothetical protein [Spirochaetota bacterium]
MKVLFIKTGVDENGGGPLCPHCDAEMKTLKVYRGHLRFLANLHVYCCPACNRALNAAAVPK